MQIRSPVLNTASNNVSIFTEVGTAVGDEAAAAACAAAAERTLVCA